MCTLTGVWLAILVAFGSGALVAVAVLALLALYAPAGGPGSGAPVASSGTPATEDDDAE